MTGITRWVLGHRRLVALFWLAITLVGVASVNSATHALKQKFSVPGKEGWQTNVAIGHLYRQTGGDGAPLVPVVTLPAGTTVSSPGVRAQLAVIDQRAHAALPGARVASFASTGNRAFVSADGRTTYSLVFAPADRSQAFNDNPKAVDHLSAALRGLTVSGAPIHLSGFDALAKQSSGGNGPGVLVEALLGGLGALAVLAFVFASLMAFVPIVIAIVSIMTTFLVVWGLTTITDVSPIVQFLVALIGLGVAIDYALLVVIRWREERAHGLQGDDAIMRSMETAGRAVVFSGTTVAVGLLALVALPLPFLRSVGYGGMLIPLVSVVVSMTLLPVILHTLGSRLDWPHKRSDDTASRSWLAWANFVVRRRWLAAATAIAVLVALIVAATSLQPGTPNANTIARSGDAKAGLVALEHSGLGSGTLLPNEVLVSGADPTAVADKLAQINGIDGAVAPAGPDWRQHGTALVEVVGSADSATDAGRSALDRVKAAVRGLPAGPRLGGIPAQNSDFIDAVYGNFPLMIALIAILTFILLARAFRSLLLPLKAVILNIVSVGAAWGVVTLIWQQGHGSGAIWGIAATGSVTAWIPLMIFAFLFGLSMDYEVFILARMREEYDATGETDTSVIRGISRTGRLVTSAAFILFLAFTSLASSPGTDVKVLATGLAAGILLDATIIRALLVPAVVSLFGRWNWWLPTWPARILRVEPSLPPRPAPERAS